MNTLRHALRTIACAAVAGAAPGSASAGARLSALGDLPGGPFESQGLAVSADGTVVVGSSRSGAGDTPTSTEAFRWTAATGMVGLGDLPGGTFSSSATGVSADGSVIAGTGRSVASDAEAFRWTAAGGMVGLGDLPGGEVQSRASGVSADGAVVVGVSGSGSGASFSSDEAFRWTAPTGMAGLGYMSGASFSPASAVNADGSVIVGRGVSSSIPPFSSATEAFRWTAADGMAGLGDLPGGSYGSAALGVTGDGAVVVGASSSSSGQEAFRWTAATGMVGLSDLAGGSFQSQAFGVSADGSVVVGRGSAGSGIFEFQDAFVWTPGGGMQRLWDVLLAAGIDPAADGWNSLTEARAVSADGTTIVGTGQRNFNTQTVAFVAVIPEPAGFAVLAVGAAAMRRRRRA